MSQRDVSNHRIPVSGHHLPWLVIGALVVALALAMATALARDSHAALQQCPPGTAWDENLGQCAQQAVPSIDIGDPPVQATIPPDIDFQVTPTVTPTPTPAPQPQVTVPPPVQLTVPPDIEILPTVTPDLDEPPTMPQLDAIEVTKWECPPGVDPDSDWPTLTANCTTPTTSTFTMSHVWPGGIEPASTSGFVEWTGLSGPPYFSPHFIGEEVPAGYGTPVAWCGLYTPGVTDPTLTRRPLDAYGMVVADPPPAAGQRFSCDWFNVRLGNEIVINKLVCPPGPDLGDDIDAWLAACADDTAGGYEFTLTTAAGSLTDTTVVGTGDAATDGNVSWYGVGSGSFSVQETIPAGSTDPRIWCGSVALDVLPHPETIPLDPVAAPGGRWDSAFDDGPARIVCYWLNMPSTTTRALESANTVEARVYTCAEEDVSRDLTARELEEICDPAIAADVTLEYADLRLGQLTGVDGMARWDGVPAGPFTLRSVVPVGTEPWLAGCNYSSWPEEALTDGTVPGPETTVDFNAPGEAVVAQATIDAVGYTVTCVLFSTVLEEPPLSTVTIKKSECATVPVGFRSLEEWLAACPAIGEGVEFTLHPPVGSPRHAATDATGSVRWTDVPSGPFGVSETPRPGFGERVWCQLDAVDAEDGITRMPPTSVSVAGGTIFGTIVTPGTEVTCHWFNIPDPTPGEGSTIIVQKSICPERIAPGADYATVLALGCTEHGDGIDFTLESVDGSSTKTVVGGMADWRDVPLGPFTLSETTEPARYPDPQWYCFEVYVDEAGDTIVERVERVSAPLGVLEGSIEHPNTTYTCYVYNFPFFDRTVTVHKWDCRPVADPPSPEPIGCRAAADGVVFTLTDPVGSVTKTTVGGTVTWYGVERGELVLDEDVPPGYGEPLVYCALEASDEAGLRLSEEATIVPSTGGAVSRNISYFEFDWVCHFYDMWEGDAEITITKRTCPPGYDVDAPGADPPADCTEATDGVIFTAGEGGPSAATGDTAPGVVRFGGLDPGVYVIAETVPDGTTAVFVWDCVGSDIPRVHPHPLSTGNALTITVAAGDSVTCDWYNVPMPEGGSLTVEKHVCRTATFVSEVDCEIFEHGAAFELTRLSTGTSEGVGTTGASGTYTWTGLAKGAYRLDELDSDPCHRTMTSDDLRGNPFVVTFAEGGAETVVKVYNCVPDTPPDDPDTPPAEPGKPPTEWPNTGPAPDGDALVVSAAQPVPATPAAGAGEPFFPVRCLDDTGATPTADETCQRGAVPAAIAIDAANVDTSIEVVEVADGVMQAPTGPNVVAWYKESGRLGEPTNMVMAGHLNWWNVPEGVFSRLADLEEGERIEVTGDNGATHVFEVQWVRQLSALAPPSAEVIGPTAEPSLTLITCGGPWDSARAEYTERTVVRAVQVDVVPGDGDA